MPVVAVGRRMTIWNSTENDAMRGKELEMEGGGDFKSGAKSPLTPQSRPNLPDIVALC